MYKYYYYYILEVSVCQYLFNKFLSFFMKKFTYFVAIKNAIKSNLLL